MNLKYVFFLVKIALRCVYGGGGRGEGECIHVCYVSMWMERVDRGQRRVSGVLLFLHLIPLRRGLSQNPELTTSGKLQLFYRYPTQIWGCRGMCDHAQCVTWS